MLEPSSWESHQPVRPTVAFSAFWVKLVVASLVFVGLTSGVRRLPGPWRKGMDAAVHHWLTVNTSWESLLPLEVRDRLPIWLQASRAVAGSRSNAWPWVIHGSGQIIRGFGWYHPGAHAQFQRGIVFRAGTGTPVDAGPGGMVVKVAGSASNHTVEERVNANQTIIFEGLAVTALAVGQKLVRNQVVGVAGTQPLTVEVLDQGFPVNPFSRSLFGAPKNWVE